MSDRLHGEAHLVAPEPQAASPHSLSAEEQDGGGDQVELDGRQPIGLWGQPSGDKKVEDKGDEARGDARCQQ